MEERSRGIRRVPVLSLSTEEVMGWRWDFDGSKVADGWTRVLLCQATDGLHSVRGSERAFAHMQLRLAGSLFASNEVRYRAPFFACLSNVV